MVEVHEALDRDPAGPLARVGDRVDLVGRQGDGLLAQDVLAGLEGLDRPRHVEVVRECRCRRRRRRAPRRAPRTTRTTPGSRAGRRTRRPGRRPGCRPRSTSPRSHRPTARDHPGGDAAGTEDAPAEDRHEALARVEGAAPVVVTRRMIPHGFVILVNEPRPRAPVPCRGAAIRPTREGFVHGGSTGRPRRGGRLLDPGDQGRARRPGDRAAGGDGPGAPRGDRHGRRAGERPDDLVDRAARRPRPDRPGARRHRDLDRRPAARPRHARRPRPAGPPGGPVERHALGSRRRGARRGLGPGRLGRTDRKRAGPVVHRHPLGLAAADGSAGGRCDPGHPAAPRLPDRTAVRPGRHRPGRRLRDRLVVDRERDVRRRRPRPARGRARRGDAPRGRGPAGGRRTGAARGGGRARPRRATSSSDPGPATTWAPPSGSACDRASPSSASARPGRPIS